MLKGHFLAMFYKFVMSHCAFGTITNYATGNNIVQLVSAAIIYAVQTIVKISSRCKAVIVTVFLNWWRIAIIAFLFRQSAELLLRKRKLMSLSICTIERIKSRYSIRQFFKGIPVTATTFRMPIFQMATTNYCCIPTLTYTFPHCIMATIRSTFDDCKKTIFAARQICKPPMISTRSETSTASSVPSSQSDTRGNLLITTFALAKPHNVSTLLSKTLCGSQPSVFNSGSIYESGHERIIP